MQKQIANANFRNKWALVLNSTHHTLKGVEPISGGLADLPSKMTLNLHLIVLSKQFAPNFKLISFRSN